MDDRLLSTVRDWFSTYVEVVERTFPKKCVISNDLCYLDLKWVDNIKMDFEEMVVSSELNSSDLG